MKELIIVGGGLAGLALGYELCRKGVPVVLHEAGTLPRHRVCGEFICGRGAEILRQLGLDDVLTGALQHEQVNWYHRNQRVLEARLPSPAFGLSRMRLDERLANAFESAGGTLHLRSRFKPMDAGAGVVLACGREPARSDWIGLKLHCTRLQTEADLELHLGDRAYLGLSGIEDGRTNVCGLFRRRPELSAARHHLLPAYLRACRLDGLAERIETGGIDPASLAAVAGVQFSIPSRQHAELRLGDAYSVMPPFTGNGMSLALESATVAAPRLLHYANGQNTWSHTVKAIRGELTVRFSKRLSNAGRLHPWISHPVGQRALAAFARLHLLPFRFLYHRTH